MNRAILREIAALIYPSRCPVCGEIIGPNDSFCQECSNILIPYNGDFTIDRCSGFTAAYEYHKNMSGSIMIMKRGIVGNAPFAFGKVLAERIRECGMDGADMLIPVPMTKADKRKRGLNQSELIAKELSKRLNIPVCSRAVEKVRRTAQQKGLGRRERLLNLKGAFSVTAPELISGKTVILVDDVCTTGGTLTELTSLLLNSGTAKVYCVSCCKTPSLKKSKE